MLKVTNLCGFARAAASVPKSGAFVTSAVSAADLTTYTFAATNIGTASATRRVVVGIIGTQSTRTVSSVTVGGTSLDFVVRDQGGVTTGEIWMGLVTSGASADIVVTWSGAQDRCGIGVWETAGLSSNTPHNTVTWNPTDIGASPSINTTTDGFVIAIAGSHGASAPTSTWASITEKYDEALEGGVNFNQTGASIDTTGTSLSFTHTQQNGGNGNAAGVAASF